MYLLDIKSSDRMMAAASNGIVVIEDDHRNYFESIKIPEVFARSKTGRNRITANPKMLGGKPVIEGTRISVEFILSLIASGWKDNDIIRNYPMIKVEDIAACLRYGPDGLNREKQILSAA
jgi:uncharacterized protein (DUF433 family)